MTDTNPRAVTPEVVREFISYDPFSGALTWKRRSETHFVSRRGCSIWNARYAGKPALDCDDGKGYKHGRVFRKGLFAHRAAWMIFYNEIPPDRIDHINGDGADNRIKNLRAVTNAENGQNSKRSVKNKTGFTGVCWIERQRKYLAYIGTGKNREYLGTFEDVVDARDARAAAEVRLGYHPNHGRLK